MKTTEVSGRRLPWRQPKSLLFTLIAVMVGYVIGHNERFLIDSADPIWDHYEPFKWWLLPHGLAGACALFLAPMQFSDRLRLRAPKLHRVAGRIYVGSVVLVVAPLGAYIQYFEERLGFGRSFTIAAIVDAILLISTTAIGFYFIIRGRVQQHRQWMTRSYAVALVFFEVRLISGVFGFDDAGPAVAELIVWICLASSLLLADILLQIQESSRRASRRGTAQPSPEPPAAQIPSPLDGLPPPTPVGAPGLEPGTPCL